MVYLYAKFLELLIHRLGLGGPQCVVLRISECVYMVFNVNKFQKVKQNVAFDDDFLNYISPREVRSGDHVHLIRLK